MFKLLEKPPFTRWKFAQRIVHKHRMANRTGSSRFKTFRQQSPSNDTEQFLETNSLTEPDTKVATSEVTTKKASPFHSKRRLHKANEDMGILLQVDLETSPGLPRRQTNSPTVSTRETNKTDVVNFEPPTENIESTGDNFTPDNAESSMCSNDTKPSKDEAESNENNTDATQISTNEHSISLDNHLIANQKTRNAPQFNSFSTKRNSKLRSSFKEFKRRSISRLDNARESMRRRTNSHKYDNLDDESKAKNNNEEIVDYDRSPGSKRRSQVIEI